MSNSGVDIPNCIECCLVMSRTGTILVSGKKRIDGGEIGTFTRCQPIEHTNCRAKFGLEGSAICSGHFNFRDS
eukprot:scaffold54895_cov35-Attheya_sp.AAC.1